MYSRFRCSARERNSLISTGGGSAGPDGAATEKSCSTSHSMSELMAVPIAPAADGRSVAPGTPVPLSRTRVGGAVQGFAEQQYVACLTMVAVFCWRRFRIDRRLPPSR